MDMKNEAKYMKQVMDEIGNNSHKYKSVYKCRLCGKVFCQGENHTENESLNKIVKLSTVFPFFLHDKGYIPHGCKDGSIGFAEFIGFRKVDE